MPRRSLPRLLRDEFAGYSSNKLRQDLLAGLTVAAVALPLGLAFGVTAGATAAAGLVTAILAGFVIGGLSGAPYRVSGPTGAMSAVLIVLAQKYGLPGIWVAGGLLLVIGLLRLGRFIAFIPGPVITGFTSGNVFWSADEAIVAAEQRSCRHCQAAAVAIDPPQLAPAAAH